MAKVKGLKKLNKVVSAQLAPFGITKAKCTSEFAYYPNKESITFKISEGIEDEMFNEYIKERYHYDVSPFSFVFSLLHEVGHHKTMNSLSDTIYDFCLSEKERIDREMEDADADTAKNLEWQYFGLPDEALATEWAVDWCKNHPKKVLKIMSKSLKALNKFYNKNGLTAESEINNE